MQSASLLQLKDYSLPQSTIAHLGDSHSQEPEHMVLSQPVIPDAEGRPWIGFAFKLNHLKSKSITN